MRMGFLGERRREGGSGEGEGQRGGGRGGGGRGGGRRRIGGGGGGEGLGWGVKRNWGKGDIWAKSRRAVPLAKVGRNGLQHGMINRGKKVVKSGAGQKWYGPSRLGQKWSLSMVRVPRLMKWTPEFRYAGLS